MKLKKVKASLEYVIVCKDGDDEAQVSRQTIGDALGDVCEFDFDFSITPYKEGGVSGWDSDCVPYGGDGEKTCAEYEQ